MHSFFHDVFKEAIKQDIAVKAQDLIAIGFNPFAAVLRENNRTADYVAKRMGVSLGYIKLVMGPFKVDTFGHGRSIEYPSADFILHFCDLMECAPDILFCPTNPEPAPSALVEAVVRHIEYMRPRRADKSALEFVLRERTKADQLAAMRLDDGTPDNLEMLGRAHRLAIEHNVFNDPGYERTEPAEDVAADLEYVVAYAASGRFAHEREFQDLKKIKEPIFENYRRVLLDAALAVAPIEDTHEWVSAFHENAKVLGYDFAAQLLQKDAGIFYPARKYWQSVSSIKDLEGNRVSGPAIVTAFCESYKECMGMIDWWHKCRKQKEQMGQHSTAIMFRWAASPMAQTFIAAEANRRYISGHLDHDDLVYQP